ncbi:hypothetical protein IV203_016402 [Nitzschia inconspicua]|uniref:Uncharacterized protein n=1 Tax=Nitzschia inconspicua TaxID=303405 RepID=A0A9K3PHC4_9STRA|nr:hypothetical protein IV203_016402 [Nitzschia inconspicua]
MPLNSENKNENLLFAIFAKAVHRQSEEYGAKHRIVAIHGIRPDTMFEFDVILRQEFSQILQVYRTPITAYLDYYEFKTGTIPWERWSVRTKPNQPVPTIIRAPSMNTTPHSHVLLEAPQAPQMPTPATPRHTSWAAVAAGTTTALPPTQPGTASNTSYTEAQIQALIASQEQILEQRLEQRLEERLTRHDQQLNQMITMLQEL